MVLTLFGSVLTSFKPAYDQTLKIIKVTRNVERKFVFSEFGQIAPYFGDLKDVCPRMVLTLFWTRKGLNIEQSGNLEYRAARKL